MTNQTSPETKNRFTFRTFILLLVPILLLAGVILLFLNTGGGLNLDSPAPIENLTIERYHLEHGHIELYVQNTGPGALTIASVIINDAVMSCLDTRTHRPFPSFSVHIFHKWKLKLKDKENGGDSSSSSSQP